MPNYDFANIMLNGTSVRQLHASNYLIPFEYGPALGFAVGFFITLAKSPPFILMDCVYGALLGLLLVVTYNLFALSVQGPTHIVVRTEPPFYSKRAQALYEEMQHDRVRYAAAKKEKQESGPIFLRTRSRTRSWSH